MYCMLLIMDKLLSKVDDFINDVDEFDMMQNNPGKYLMVVASDRNLESFCEAYTKLHNFSTNISSIKIKNTLKTVFNDCAYEGMCDRRYPYVFVMIYDKCPELLIMLLEQNRDFSNVHNCIYCALLLLGLESFVLLQQKGYYYPKHAIQLLSDAYKSYSDYLNDDGYDETLTWFLDNGYKK